MLEVYVDDSASDIRADKRLVLAGYMQSAEAWQGFVEDWLAELARPPTLVSLHMIKSFEGWSAEAREAKIDALVAVLAKYRPLSIECSISREVHAEHLRDRAPYDLRHPYSACFVGMMHGVAKTVVEEGLRGPVNMILDFQGSVGEESALWYLPLKHADPRLASVLGGPPRFATEEDAVPLQAADMLAWYVRRAAEARCTARQLEVANALRFRHRYLAVPDYLVKEWGDAFRKVPGIEYAMGKRGSTRKLMRSIVGQLPQDRVGPAIEGLAKRGARLHRIRSVLRSLGLEFARKWLAKFWFGRKRRR